MPICAFKKLSWKACIAIVMLVALQFNSVRAADNDADNDTGLSFDLNIKAPKIILPRIELPLFWSDDLKRGREAYAEQNYDKALSAFLSSAEDGNMIAEWYLGHMHRLGRGVKANQTIAYSYFNRVADHFDPRESDQGRLRVAIDARIRVADYLRLGIPDANVEPNPTKAARTYLELATNFGHPRALYGLGVMTMEGEAMRPNPKQGLKWLRAAARKHSPDAAAYLGDMFINGRVVQKDEVKGLSWYIVAAGMCSKDDYPIIHSRLNKISFESSDETRLEAEASARIWFEQNPGPAQR